MHTAAHIDHPAGSLTPRESSPDLPETDIIERGVQPDFTMSPVDDERAAVLLAALEELELRRAALERLVDENLLWRCLV
jgi:hypothetical protein